MAKKVKPAVKIVLFAILGALLFGGYIVAEKSGVIANLAPEGGSGSASSGSNDDCIKVGVITWGGYAGGEYFIEALNLMQNLNSKKIMASVQNLK